MQIRFTKFTPCGSVQIGIGELLDLPDTVAQQHIDAGNAVAVARAETATVPHHESAPAYPSPRRTAQKATKVRR